MIEHLFRLGVEVSLFTVGSGTVDLMDAERLVPFCEEVVYREQPLWRSLLNCFAAAPTTRSFQSVYSWNPGLGMELRERIGVNSRRQKYDVVHIEHLRGARYAEFVRSSYPDIPLIWDSVDCISHLFKHATSQSRGLFGRLVSKLDINRTQKTEGKQICRVDHTLVTSSVDRNALLDLVPNGQSSAPVSILSNGADLEYYRQPDLIQKEPETIVFSGKMSYHANVTMATYLIHEIMPRVWQAKPKVKVALVGKDPPPSVRQFAKDSRVSVTGTVDDLRPYLWKASVAVVPLVYGSGIQNKILEAMAAGTPVVSTSRTLPALQAKPGKDLLIADYPDDFAAQILRLLNEPDLHRAIRSSGKQYVEEFHNWKHIAKQLVGIYQQTAELKAEIRR
ncbi:MAG: glycosyltransferase [Anaerolineales bacterium]|nr:glycosyltransferase [Anaerolineales bacterium]